VIYAIYWGYGNNMARGMPLPWKGLFSTLNAKDGKFSCIFREIMIMGLSGMGNRGSQE